MSSFVILLFLFRINLLVTSTNLFNLSSVDKDELWHLLLNRQITHNDSSAFDTPSNYDNVHDNEDVVNAVVVYDKVNEFRNDVIDGGVKVELVEYHDESKPTDENLQSRFMDIFNVSVVGLNETDTSDTIRHNVSDTAVDIDDNLSDVPYENFKFKREEYSVTTTPSVIEIDVFKPSESELDSDEEVEIFKSTVRSKPKPGQTSLVIVFDGTGSMENCLIQLRAGAKQIIDKFSDRDDNPIYNYIFVPFRDPCEILKFIFVLISVVRSFVGC